MFKPTINSQRSMFEMKMTAKQVKFTVLITVVPIIILIAIFSVVQGDNDLTILQEILHSNDGDDIRLVFAALYLVIICLSIFFALGKKTAYILIQGNQITTKSIVNLWLGSQGKVHTISPPVELEMKMRGGGNKAQLTTKITGPSTKIKYRLSRQFFGKDGMNAYQTWMNSSFKSMLGGEHRTRLY